MSSASFVPPTGVEVGGLQFYFAGRARDASAASARHEVAEVLWRRPEEVDPAGLASPTTRAAFVRYAEVTGHGSRP